MSGINYFPEKVQKARELKADVRREVGELASGLLHLTPTTVGPPDGVDVDVQQIRESVASKLGVNMWSMSEPDKWVASHESPPDWCETIVSELGEEAQSHLSSKGDAHDRDAHDHTRYTC
ncbi:MAG: hypothetical protein ACREOZ_04575 [Gloeomargaritales cyanobacterium]